MKDLVIIGAGSVGGYIAHNFDEYRTNYNLIGLLDDDPAKIGLNVFGYPVLGDVDTIFKEHFKNVAVVIGIAFPKMKEKIIDKLKSKKTFHFPGLVSKDSWISNNVKIGAGSIIYPGVSINYGARIDDFVVINMNCAIGHDCFIGEYSSLAPGVSLGGHTTIESCVDMGIGSATIQNIKIASNSIIGGKSMVIRDIPENSTVIGVPAKPVKSHGN